MSVFQKELAIAKLDKALEILDKLASTDCASVTSDALDDLRQAAEMITKAKDHISNV